MKEKLKEGDILHCTRNALLSKIIRFFTKSKFNHTAMVIEIYGELFIAESQSKGTYPISLSNWENKYKYTYIIARPDKFTDEIKKRAISKFGIAPYDFLSLFYQAFYQVTGKWIGKTKNDADERLYCSEFISYAYIFEKWWKKSPEDVYQITLKSKFKIIE